MGEKQPPLGTVSIKDDLAQPPLVLRGKRLQGKRDLPTGTETCDTLGLRGS